MSVVAVGFCCQCVHYFYITQLFTFFIVNYLVCGECTSTSLKNNESTGFKKQSKNKKVTALSSLPKCVLCSWQGCPLLLLLWKTWSLVSLTSVMELNMGCRSKDQLHTVSSDRCLTAAFGPIAGMRHAHRSIRDLALYKPDLYIVLRAICTVRKWTAVHTKPKCLWYLL